MPFCFFSLAIFFLFHLGHLISFVRWLLRATPPSKTICGCVIYLTILQIHGGVSIAIRTLIKASHTALPPRRQRIKRVYFSLMGPPPSKTQPSKTANGHASHRYNTVPPTQPHSVSVWLFIFLSVTACEPFLLVKQAAGVAQSLRTWKIIVTLEISGWAGCKTGVMLYILCYYYSYISPQVLRASIFSEAVGQDVWCFQKNVDARKSKRNIEYIMNVVSIQQVVLPLLEQYVKSHHLYFLSSSLGSNDNKSHASKKEKEMVAWYVSTLTKLISCSFHSYGTYLSFSSCSRKPHHPVFAFCVS